MPLDPNKFKSAAAKEVAVENNKKESAVSAIFDKIDSEQNGVATKAQQDEIVKLNKEIEEGELKATNLLEFENLRAQNEERKATAARARLPFNDMDDPKGDKGDGRDRGSERYREARKSVGEKVLEDKDFGVFQKSGNHSGRVQSPVVEVKTLLTSGTTSGGAAVWSQRFPDIVNASPYQILTLLDLITVGETGSNAVEYPRYTGFTNNGAPVAEASTSGLTATDGLKPESAMTFEKILEAVKTLAHWIPITTRTLEDAPQLRTFIDGFLQFGLKAVAENLMLNGDGTGENFLGILNTPNIQAQAFVTDILATTRKARTKCRTPGRVVPTAYLLHPIDWEAFDLDKDAQGRYYFGGPSILGNPRLWGLPVVENESIAVGTGLTGDFKYAMLWQRMEAMISVSDSPGNFFLRNLLAVLAEERAAFGVMYPKAFVSIDLTP